MIAGGKIIDVNSKQYCIFHLICTLKIVSTLRWTENQSWDLATRPGRTVCVSWRFFCEGNCNSWTRGAGQSVIEVIGIITWCDFRCSSVCYIWTNWNPMGKKNLKCLDTWIGRIEPSLLRKQGTTTVQTNGDLESSWTAGHSPQAIPLQNHVSIGLEINGVDSTRAVSPWAAERIFGSAAPAVTINYTRKLKIQLKEAARKKWIDSLISGYILKRTSPAKTNW